MRERILVTGAAGHVGSVSRLVTESLLKLGYPVRAFVRSDDDRAEHLRSLGAEIFVGDLLNAADVANAVDGCKRIYFSMSLNPYYADATILIAAAAKRQGGAEIFVNMSEFEQEYMTLDAVSAPRSERIAAFGADVTWSPQQRAHWVAEQALDWSGLPVTHIRAAMFVENPILFWIPAAKVVSQDALPVPFGDGETAPVATIDVADVIVKILADPEEHAGKSYALTGPERKTMHGFAEEFSDALGRKITYIPVPMAEWTGWLHAAIADPHIRQHLQNLALQNASGQYIAEVTSDVERLLGRPATSFGDVVRSHSWRFASSAERTAR